MKNIAIFASGSGTNAENIIRHFAASPVARVTLVVSDNPDAYTLKRAQQHGVKSVVIPRTDFREGSQPVKILKENDIDYIVLAGFLSLVPAPLVDAYRGRIVNIHPALLPAYGGKGMYGERVHRAVIENRKHEHESGITIHAVNEHYDQGDIIAQYRVGVDGRTTAKSLARKIHKLEYQHFPEIIEREIAKLLE